MRTLQSILGSQSDITRSIVDNIDPETWFDDCEKSGLIKINTQKLKERYYSPANTKYVGTLYTYDQILTSFGWVKYLSVLIKEFKPTEFYFSLISVGESLDYSKEIISSLPAIQIINEPSIHSREDAEKFAKTVLFKLVNLAKEDHHQYEKIMSSIDNVRGQRFLEYKKIKNIQL